MQTLFTKLSRVGVFAAVCGFVAFGLGGRADAQGKLDPVMASDEPAGYIVFPKLAVDTQGVLKSSDGVGLDTVIQLTNTDLESVHDVHCYYVNANSFCSNATPDTPGVDPIVCEGNSDCPSPNLCVPYWRVTNFHLSLTPGQPIAWSVGSGASFLPCDPNNPDPASQNCLVDNSGAIPPTEDPFRGELKCVETDSGDVPVERNDIIGQASIYRVTAESPGMVDVSSYNGVGFQARGNGVVGVPNDILCLGGALTDGTSSRCPRSEYAGCPAVLILSHFFEGAKSPVNGTSVATNLTLVPCTENLEGGENLNLLANQVKTTGQMLIYNEFEQRFSTAMVVDCYRDIQLADIDTRPGAADNGNSVFSVGVQGTLTGQTRIRGVEGVEPDKGHGLLAVAQEFYSEAGHVVGTAALNLNYFGERAQRDEVSLTVPR